MVFFYLLIERKFRVLVIALLGLLNSSFLVLQFFVIASLFFDQSLKHGSMDGELRWWRHRLSMAMRDEGVTAVSTVTGSIPPGASMVLNIGFYVIITVEAGWIWRPAEGSRKHANDADALDA
jgi:hypothetical protein